jgi:hypothetical protein
MLGRLSILLLLLPILGTPAFCGEYEKVHSIAVISALGNDFVMQNLGSTRLSSDEYTLHTDWNLDTQVKDVVAKALSSHFTVKDATGDTQIFLNLKNGLFSNFYHQMRDRIKTLPRNEEIDAYVIVYPNLDDVPSIPGLSVIHEHSIFHSEVMTVYAYYKIGVFDATTGEMIDYGSAQYPASGYLFGHQPPFEQCANDIWADSEVQYTAEQKNRLRQEMASLITRSIAYTLASAKLISKSEAASFTTQNALPSEPSCHPA